MILRHEDISIPDVVYSDDINSLTSNMYTVSDGLRRTIENVEDISRYIDVYVEHILNEREKQLTEKIASKTYDMVSELIEWNICKEEFIKLLLCDETSDPNG